MSNSVKKLAGETVIYGLGAVLPKVVNFLLIASYLTFQINTESYGIHGLMYSFITLALVVFTLRMETTFFKFASDVSYDAKDVYNTALSIVLLSSTVLLVIIIAFRVQIAAALSRPEDFRYVIYFGFILFLDAIAAVPFAKLRQDNRPILFSTIKILNSLLTVGLVVFCFNILPHIKFLSFLYDEKYFLDYTFLANLVGSLFIVIMLSKELISYKWSWNRALVNKMFKYSWPLIIVGIAGSINQFSDRIFISYLTKVVGSDEQNFVNAGLFTGAIKIAVIMNLFVTAFNYAAEPFFFKNASKASRDKLYGIIALAFTICGSLIFMGVCFYIDILKYMVDRSYHDVLYIVPVALLANLFLGLYYNFSIWYKLSGKTIFGALIAIIGSIIFISLNFILIPIPSIGLMGANFASLSCFMVMCLLAYLLGKKYYPIHYPIVRMSIYLSSSVLLYYLVDVLGFQGLTKIIVGSGIMIIYAVVAYIMDLRALLSRN